MPRKNNFGFTLIELLVVIAIISLISSIVLATIREAREKSRDARRKEDLYQLKTAVELYTAEYGFPPTTASYGENNTGGWDSSYEGDFMQFLTGTAGSANPNNIEFIPTIPKDPINSGSGDCSSFTGYHYCYYCYTWPAWGINQDHFRIGTRLENTGQTYWVVSIF